MSNSIFSRKSSTASKTSKKCQEEYNLLTQALKNIVRRLLICYKSLCCFPLDQIVPPNPRRYKKGLHINLKPGLCQTSEKVLNDIKIIHIVPRSRVSFNDPARVKSEICSGKRVRSEISNAKKVKSEISPAKKVKSGVSLLKLDNKELPPEKIKITRMFKEKSKKFLDFGSGSIKHTFRYKKKSSGAWKNTDTSAKIKKKSKNDVRSEKRWIMTKKVIKISNPSHLKWINGLTKPREILTTSSTDNEESAGDGPETPKVSCTITKIPLPWKTDGSVKEQSLSDTHIDLIKKDVDKQVILQII